MDGYQIVRRGQVLATARRLAVMLACGALGIVVGTQLLVALPAWAATLVLGASPRLRGAQRDRVLAAPDPRWECPLGPLAGLTGVGGVTNMPGTVLVMLFYALGIAKDEFVSSMALSFVV